MRNISYNMPVKPRWHQISRKILILKNASIYNFCFVHFQFYCIQKKINYFEYLKFVPKDKVSWMVKLIYNPTNDSGVEPDTLFNLKS